MVAERARGAIWRAEIIWRKTITRRRTGNDRELCCQFCLLLHPGWSLDNRPVVVVQLVRFAKVERLDNPLRAICTGWECADVDIKHVVVSDIARVGSIPGRAMSRDRKQVTIALDAFNSHAIVVIKLPAAKQQHVVVPW